MSSRQLPRCDASWTCAAALRANYLMLWCFWLDTGWPFPGEKARVHRLFALHLQVICPRAELKTDTAAGRGVGQELPSSANEKGRGTRGNSHPSACAEKNGPALVLPSVTLPARRIDTTLRSGAHGRFAFDERWSKQPDKG